MEIQNGIYGFQDQGKMKGSFIRYVEYLAEKCKDSEGNYGNWDSVEIPMILSTLVRL